MGGTIYDYIMERVGDLDFVVDYRAGRISRDEFVRRVRNASDALEGRGLSPFQITKLGMFPATDRGPAEAMLAGLARAGFLDDPTPDDAGYRAFARGLRGAFRHLEDRYTYIFPDEARAAWEFARVIRPSHVVVCGAYYNYLAVWVASGLAADGTMECLDIDCGVSEHGDANMRALGLADRVTTRCADAERALLERAEPIDLLVVDATGPTTHPDPRYHGKSIYGPFLRAALPRMPRGSWVLAHNADPDTPLLEEFYSLLSSATYRHFVGTTDDLAVFRL